MKLRIGKLDLAASYQNWVSEAVRSRGESGWSFAIGGEFEAFGIIQREMLIHYGLPPNGRLIEIGCGSGRLAKPLGLHLTSGSYLGFDIVPDLVRHAEELAGRPDWQFKLAKGLTIPAPDGQADMVCCFSVFTHLLHEQSYLYLEEAARVLRPGGKIVFSFLEFGMGFHWNVFAATVEQQRQSLAHPLNVFIERRAITAWADHLGLRIAEFRDGSDDFVPLPHPVTLDDGRVMTERGNLGQSICVLAVPD